MAVLRRWCALGVAGGKLTLGDESFNLGLGVSTLGDVTHVSFILHSAIGTRGGMPLVASPGGGARVTFVMSGARYGATLGASAGR
jgi:hypothetical protein